MIEAQPKCQGPDGELRQTMSVPSLTHGVPLWAQLTPQEFPEEMVVWKARGEILSDPALHRGQYSPTSPSITAA